MVQSEIQLYNTIIHKVWFFYKGLRLDKLENKKGRKLALSIPEVITAAIFKQEAQIKTKKQTYIVLQPNCSYKTLNYEMALRVSF